jgi:hypothetical protein
MLCAGVKAAAAKRCSTDTGVAAGAAVGAVVAGAAAALDQLLGQLC